MARRRRLTDRTPLPARPPQAFPPADSAAQPLLNLLSLRHYRSLFARAAAAAAAPAATPVATGLIYLPSDAQSGIARAAVSAAAPVRVSLDPSAAVSGLIVFTAMWDDVLSIALPHNPGLDILVSCDPSDPSANADVGPAGSVGAADGSGVLFSLRSGADGVSSLGEIFVSQRQD